jgi:hypothetical protein
MLMLISASRADTANAHVNNDEVSGKEWFSPALVGWTFNVACRTKVKITNHININLPHFPHSIIVTLQHTHTFHTNTILAFNNKNT